MSGKKLAYYNDLSLSLSTKGEVKIKSRNIKETLCKISVDIGFEYNKDYSLQYLSNKLMRYIDNVINKNTIYFGKPFFFNRKLNYKLFCIKHSYNGIEIIVNNNIAILTKISNEVGFAHNTEWSEQEFCANLIDFLNEPSNKNVYGVKNKVIEKYEDNTSISDEDWDWWLNLSDRMRYILLWNIDYYELYFNDSKTVSYRLNNDKFYDKESSKTRYYVGDITGRYYNKDHIRDEGILTKFVWPTINNYQIWNPIDADELASLAYLKSIEEISLVRADMKELPATISKLIHIKSLDLSSNNRLYEKELTKLLTLKNLETLSLKSLGLIKLPDVICKLSSIKVLNLEYNRISSKELSKLAALPNLKVLNLKENVFDPDGEDDLSGLFSLKQLEKLLLSKVEPSLIFKLQEQLPNCEIIN